MAAVRASLGCRQRRAAGIGEKVKEVERLCAFLGRKAYRFCEPSPHGACFGKYPEMAKVGSGEFHFYAIDSGLPCVRQAVAPAPFKSILAGEKRIGLFPYLRA